MNPRKRQPKPTKPAGLVLVQEFPLKAIGKIGEWHDLGKVIPAAEQAKAPGVALPPHILARDATKLLSALNGSGPRQDLPHFQTSEVLSEALARLRDHAVGGDADAFNSLARLTFHVVADLHEVARRHPGLAARWGKQQAVIPVLMGRNPGHTEDLADALSLFAVGEGSPFRVNSGKGKGRRAPSTRTNANAIAAALYQHLAAYRISPRLMNPPIPTWARHAAGLPDLSAESVEQWWTAAEACLKSSLGGEPLSKWSELGDHREPEDGVNGSTAAQEAGAWARLRRGFKQIAREAGTQNRLSVPRR
jgi:hypothetical protein